MAYKVDRRLNRSDCKENQPKPVWVLRFLLHALALGLCIGFWFLSAPIYALALLCDWLDDRLSRLLEYLCRYWKD